MLGRDQLNSIVSISYDCKRHHVCGSLLSSEVRLLLELSENEKVSVSSDSPVIATVMAGSYTGAAARSDIEDGENQRYMRPIFSSLWTLLTDYELGCSARLPERKAAHSRGVTFRFPSLLSQLSDPRRISQLGILRASV